MPMRIRRDGPVPVVTFATDGRAGFSDDDIADLTRLVDMMGAVIEMHIERNVGRNAWPPPISAARSASAS